MEISQRNLPHLPRWVMRATIRSVADCAQGKFHCKPSQKYMAAESGAGNGSIYENCAIFNQSVDYARSASASSREVTRMRRKLICIVNETATAFMRSNVDSSANWCTGVSHPYDLTPAVTISVTCASDTTRNLFSCRYNDFTTFRTVFRLEIQGVWETPWKCTSKLAFGEFEFFSIFQFHSTSDHVVGMGNFISEKAGQRLPANGPVSGITRFMLHRPL